MRLISAFIIIFITASLSCAQTNEQLIDQGIDINIPFTISQYGTKHGLPQSQVLSIIHKQNGNLIICTANGIVEYNGLEFKPITEDNTYKKQLFTKLTWHEKTKNLFGEDLNGKSFLVLPKFKPIENCIASCIEKDDMYCIDVNGTIYKGNVNDLKFTKIAMSHITGTMALFYENDNLLIGGLNGIYKLNLTSKQQQKIVSDVVYEFKKNPYNNCIYAICLNSIFKIVNETKETIINFEDKNIRCKSIIFVRANEYFIGTTRGLFNVIADYSNNYTRKKYLATHYIQSLYYNKAENCLFVGTPDKGLLKLILKNCISFSVAQGFYESASLNSIIKTNSGDILTSVADGYIYKIDSERVYPYYPQKTYYSSLAEIDGVIYAGTWGQGLKLIKNKQLIDSITAPKKLKSKHAFSAFQDSKKNIWIGGYGISKGTSYKNVMPYLTDKIKGRITTFYELKNKNICIGGGDGVYIIGNNGKILTHLGKQQGIKGRGVRAFYEDFEGKLWIGTYGGGLYCYFKEKLKSINSLDNSKLYIDAFCLAKDTLGYLYITSNNGLWRVSENDLSDFYYGKLNYLIPFYYGEETGILNTEFNGGFQNNYLRITNGQFYFPNIQGVVKVTPEKPVFKKITATLDEIFINDTLFNLSTNAVLERSTHMVQFKFSCVSFIKKHNIYYQYKLQRLSEKENWSPLSKEGAVLFKLLPPGKYTFIVRALDAFNDRNPNETVYQFEIKPYFYETLWFKIFVVISLSILIIVFVKQRIYINKKKAEEQERIKRELVELELKAVQAQMNPHFIFNSLNSIKHYLFINDTKSADTFIDHFSALLRDFLDYSAEDFITLEKETEMLTSYLFLEKTRMNPPFEFFISLPDALKKVKIPTLLIQPFVENAVKHGIAHSTTSCTLDIHFELINDYLIFTINDNGIGRKKSNEINQHRNYHTSKGIAIVNDKIKIIKELYGIVATITIKDKVNSLGEALGTLVTIKIPKKND